MSEVDAVNSGTMPPQAEQQPGEQGMVSKERWETIRRLFVEERLAVSEIARAVYFMLTRGQVFDPDKFYQD